ncbi:MAG: hypothetical protein ABIR91_01260, partial [Candidatus Saccharimonadales bacterium]
STMLNGGSGMAGPIWRSTMIDALANVRDSPFAVPSGVVQKSVCYGNGGLSSGSGDGTYREYFLSSALPTARCSPTVKPDKPVQETPKPEEPETCPEGQTGTPPECETIVVPEPCPEGQTGTPPDCQDAEPAICPDGTTGTPPTCVTTPSNPQPVPPRNKR